MTHRQEKQQSTDNKQLREERDARITAQGL